MRRLMRYYLLLILMFPMVNATVIRVPQDQPTIQRGIDATSDGDTVLAQVGTYFENINFNGKNIVVASLFLTTGDTSYISQTVIDGNKSGSVVTFQNGEDSSAVLCGLTITNGLAFGFGGGILCASSSPSLVNLIVTGNISPEDGGGIYCSTSNPRMVNVAVIGNTAIGYGGGINCFNGNPNLVNVTVAGNTALCDGGGINIDNASPRLVNVMVTGNTSNYAGGGITCDHASPDFVNVTVTGNTATFGGGIYCWYSSPRLVNTILWNNSLEEIYFSNMGDSNSVTIAYSDIQGGEEGIVTNNNGTVYWLDGNIDIDPLFAEPDNGDFQLQAGSLCIDAGTTFFVWEEDTLINLTPSDYVGFAPDMGAYEYGAVSIVNTSSLMPKEFVLHQNYPNPFNPVTTLRYSLPKRSDVRIIIYDMLGRKVRTLINKSQNAGYRSVIWDATNDYGKPVSAGIYLYQIKAGDFGQTRKMVLLK